MIEKITNQNQIARHKLAEKINEIIDWINDVCALNVTNKQVTANLPNIDAGELTYLQKENSDLKDEVELLQKKLEIAIESLKCICDMGASKKIFEIPRHIQMWEEASQALEQINNIEKGE